MARREETTRMCALTRRELPVAELIRFVLGPDGVLVPDTEAKAEGRGVWITLNQAAVAEAVKKKVFGRSLKTEVTLPEDLPGLTRLRLEQRLLVRIGHGAQGRAIHVRRDQGAGAAGKGRPHRPDYRERRLAGRAQQDDGAAQRPSITRRAKKKSRGSRSPHFELLSSEQLGLALGLENVIHAALTRGAAAQAAVEKAKRLARYSANPGQDDTGRDAVDGDVLPDDIDKRREIHG